MPYTLGYPNQVRQINAKLIIKLDYRKMSLLRNFLEEEHAAFVFIKQLMEEIVDEGLIFPTD